MRLELEIAVQFALGLLETFSRQDFALILAGVRHTASGRDYDRLLERWRRQQKVVRIGRGREARFRITDKIRHRVETVDPTVQWDRRWDGKWRVFSFDLPEIRRKERLSLWRQLRAAKFGFLQRSVWVWPHDVEVWLREMVEAQGIPECFCGFDAGRLFLCDAAEIVASAWDWKRIGHDHDVYLQQEAGAVRALRSADRLEELIRLARVERDVYRAAFRLDPLLPRDLWVNSYQGHTVEQLHCKYQACLRDRIGKAALA
jgi:phenylacetic acid degradation operon negative regulatory protein